MLVIFFLIAVSLFIPPVWFITCCYTIYLIATKDQRRDQIIMDEIMQSIAQERKRVILDYLYFDSAKNFALEHGAVLVSGDGLEETLVVELDIDGKNYQIILQQWNNDETLLSVYSIEHKQKQESASILRRSSNFAI